jgi:hypothetical protein
VILTLDEAKSGMIAHLKEGRDAELCQTPGAAFMDFAAKHGVPPLRHSFEDLEEERQTADRLKA